MTTPTGVEPFTTSAAVTTPPPDARVDTTARAVSGDDQSLSPTLELRQGIVNAVDLSTARCTVTLGGGDTAIPTVSYLSNYKPTVGDTVWVLVNGPDLLALDRDGRFGSAAWAGMGRSSVTASQSRNNGAYGDLATVGPSVATTIPASGRLLVCVSADVQSPSVSGSAAAFMSFAISGAHTLAASDSNALMTLTYDGGSHSHFVNATGSGSGSVSLSGSTSCPAGSGSAFVSGSVNVSVSVNGSSSFAYSYSATEIIASRVALLTGLTPGAATVTAKYRTSTGTGIWADRDIWVLPL